MTVADGLLVLLMAAPTVTAVFAYAQSGAGIPIPILMTGLMPNGPSQSSNGLIEP